jgi:hypothetical protein
LFNPGAGTISALESRRNGNERSIAEAVTREAGQDFIRDIVRADV